MMLRFKLANASARPGPVAGALAAVFLVSAISGSPTNTCTASSRRFACDSVEKNFATPQSCLRGMGLQILEVPLSLSSFRAPRASLLGSRNDSSSFPRPTRSSSTRSSLSCLLLMLQEHLALHYSLHPSASSSTTPVSWLNSSTWMKT